MSMAELITTDGAIAMGNLEASLVSMEKLSQTRPSDPIILSNVIHLLCARGQYRGVISDYERAAFLSEKLLKVAPGDVRSHLARAEILSVFHEFEQALSELDAAAKLKELPAAEAERRASVLHATGQLEPALAFYHQRNQRGGDISSMGMEAALLAERGERKQAESLFIEAQRHDADVAPFALAWLYLQQGMMWEAAGDLSRAQELYAAAHERLPVYAAVTAHLAAIEAGRAKREEAIALLRPLVAASDDPEYLGQLGGLLKDASNLAEAEPLLKEARERYQTLLKAHPRAFAAHAARFYLNIDGNAKAAAEWAELNYKNTNTADAQSLLCDAAAAAGDGARACSLADELLKRPVLTDKMRVTAARAFLACGQKERGDATLRAIPAAQ